MCFCFTCFGLFLALSIDRGPGKPERQQPPIQGKGPHLQHLLSLHIRKADFRSCKSMCSFFYDVLSFVFLRTVQIHLLLFPCLLHWPILCKYQLESLFKQLQVLNFDSDNLYCTLGLWAWHAPHKKRLLPPLKVCSPQFYPHQYPDFSFFNSHSYRNS